MLSMQILSPNPTNKHFAVCIGVQKPNLNGCFDAHVLPQQLFVVAIFHPPVF